MSIWSFVANTSQVWSRLESANMRSSAFAGSLDVSVHNNNKFFRIIAAFCRACKIANAIAPSEILEKRFDPIDYNYTTGHRTKIDLTIQFYVDQYDTALVLGEEINGRLAIADNISTTPEVSLYLTETPYLAVDFSSSGTNPLQFLYDSCRVLQERATSDSRSYPDNEPGFFINISSKKGSKLCSK